MKRDILYVDDEPSNLIVFEAAFEETFNVYTAANADEALNFLKSQPVPVVVADQRMPDMTGVEMFGLIRKIYPHTQRVILSGFADSDAIIDAINEGQVFQFVRKPWQRVELLSVLHRALDAHDLAVQNSVLTERLLVSERCAMLGQASGRIAHEMANQLNILPLIELIEDDYREDEQLLEFAEVARLTYERLTELIEEVKAFVRFQPQNAELKPLDLDESIHELASFIRFSRTVPQEQLSIDIRARPKILGHKLKLHQVLVNLIKNASHAIADRTEGRVQVTLDKADGDAVISVSDNGTGISPENLERIWEPFFSTKGDAGNGMGLDVAKRLIAAQNGEICCESELAKGTCFTIRIPLLAEGKDDSPEKNSAAPANPSSAKPVPLS